jgi:hypothetical protein
MFSPANDTEVFWFLDIQDRVVYGGERGLLGLAFDPDYSTNKHFYVSYTNPDIVISRFTAINETMADPNSELFIISWKHPFENHNAGQLAFGPDGFLYISTGDGGAAGDPLRNAQNTKSLLGKMLRIDVRSQVSVSGTSQKGTIHETMPAGSQPPSQETGGPSPSQNVTRVNAEVRSIFSNYTIPQDNPFLNNSNYLPEIWALGLRNPFRFSFDPDTGAIWLGDSGQNTWEEIDVMFPGENYGWPNLEGPACYYPPRMCQEFGRLPVFAFNHTAPLLRPASVVIGGHVYRGALSVLRGMYIFAESISGTVWALSENMTSAGETRSPTTGSSEGAMFVAMLGKQISSFGVDVNDELYFLNYVDGYVYGFRGVSTTLGSAEESAGLGTAASGSGSAPAGGPGTSPAGSARPEGPAQSEGSAQTEGSTSHAAECGGTNSGGTGSAPTQETSSSGESPRSTY